MAPVRRYLRITKYSVLECRIYLDNPALAQSWLLNPRDPALPRITEAVRPLVLPKLREEQERERTRKKGAKKRNIKDVVSEEDFEVSIFLTETSTRHSLLYKQRHLRDKTQTRLQSNSTRLTGASREAPVDVDGGSLSSNHATVLRREESDQDDAVALEEIPTLEEAGPRDEMANRRPRRQTRVRTAKDDGREAERDLSVHIPDSDSSASGSDSYASGRSDEMSSAATRLSRHLPDAEPESDFGLGDDKKKMAMDVSYEGFAIYGRVLCLVVKRRDATATTGPGSAMSMPLPGRNSSAGPPAGQAMMENWITSTQIPAAADNDESETWNARQPPVSP